MTPTYTNQRQLRRAFWEQHPEASKRRGREGDYLTDTRVLFCDWIESLVRAGEITPALCNRVTLTP